MGINFPDVRYIINWGPPTTIIDQHQQAGRAGRDGLGLLKKKFCFSSLGTHTYIKFYLNTLAPTTRMLVSMGGVRTELQIHGHIVCKRRNTHMHTSN